VANLAVEGSFNHDQILERIDDSEFANQADKQRFTDQLFHSFNAALFGIAVQSDKVQTAIKKISPADGLMTCLAAYGELREARKQQISFATVSLIRSATPQMKLTFSPKLFMTMTFTRRAHKPSSY
jgi:hypothetical protein